ncbi:hypothetical protein AB9P05_24205 [Roseivirga sp. BDSF3-8]|uniref:hypothetical protein n=1 Tax=Roseivirga sp. BDSF3-8 TaxID=3241598 RepID=UPI0035326B81
MKKLLIFILIIIIAPLLGGLYGIIHDQLTYSISPEYYTKFKFYQFGLMDMGNEAIFPQPRIQVSVVGFMATWWMGVPIGLILGLVGFIHKDGSQMLRVTFRAMLITIAVTLLTGLLGLAYGIFHLAKTGVHWKLPENLVDVSSFIAVGSMHNFSYLGGLFGLVAGVIYSIVMKNIYKKKSITSPRIDKKSTKANG